MKVKLLIPLLVLLAACTSEKPMTDEQKAAVKEEGSAVVQEFYDANKKIDADKMFDLMENNPDFEYILSGDILSFDQMKEMAAQYGPYFDRQTFLTKFEKYVVISPSCFIYIWQGDNGAYMKSGDSTIIYDYLMTYVFRKEEGKWKILYGQETAKAPLPVDVTDLEQ